MRIKESVKQRGGSLQEERGELGLASVGKGLRLKGLVKPEGWRPP